MCDELHGVRQSNVIFLSYEKSGAPMLDCFRYPTMARRNDGQAGSHRFQYRVWHTFLVFVGGDFAGMQKQMRTRIKLEEFPLRKKPNKVYVSKNSQSIGEHFQFWLEWSFAGNEEFRFGIVLLKNRKGAQACRNTLLRNQPARLHDSPFAIARRLPVHEWKFIERDTGAINPQFFRRTTQVDQPVGERLGTSKHEWNCVEKTA